MGILGILVALTLIIVFGSSIFLLAPGAELVAALISIVTLLAICQSTHREYYFCWELGLVHFE
ncbi:MAG: hypothetical protein LEGION0403_FIIPPAGN_02455 [Legionella sp.]|uniref:hypothetical protein n=1 Tax=Legionella sp. TaxID=459 RepID=UPI003D0E458D